MQAVKAIKTGSFLLAFMVGAKPWKRDKRFNRTMPSEFLKLIDKLPQESKGMLTLYSLNEARDIRFYVNSKQSAGYGITKDGELVNLFSAERGQGSKALKDAIEHGAMHLNCFDTWLVSFYHKYGFREYRREKNWTEGQPDVVFMQLYSAVSKAA